MGLRSWISQRFGSAPQRVDLLTPTSVAIDPPFRAGIDASALPMPWSVARLQVLFEAMELQPSSATDQAARLARHQLSRFWLAAVDQLEMLYGSYRCIAAASLKGRWCSRTWPLTKSAGAISCWHGSTIRTMPRPGQLSAGRDALQARQTGLNDPLGSLPDWLLNDYSVHCEPELVMPVGLLEPAQEAVNCLHSRPRGEDAVVWFEMKRLCSAWRR